MNPVTRTRVVVADDHAQIRDRAASILSQSCDVVAAVADGASAVDAALRHRPDIVVLDIAMPGLDGFQTASRLRASGLEAPILFLSNHTGEEFVLAGISRGAAGFVAKTRMHVDLASAVAHARAGRSVVPSAGVLPKWKRPQGERHDLQLYASDADLVSAALAFFDSALESGDSIIAVLSVAHLDAFEARLTGRALDVEALAASGRYTKMSSDDALEAVCRDGLPDITCFAAALDPILERALAASVGSPPHVSMFGAIAPILCARGELDAMSRLETIAHEYAASRPLSILCTYASSAVADPAAASVICGHHAAISPAGAHS